MNRNALFYPQIVCLDEGVLKYLVLHFDKVYFLPNDTRLNPGHTSIVSRFSINDTMLFSAFGTPQDVHYSNMYASESGAWDDKLKRLMAMYEQLESDGVCVPLQDESFYGDRGHPLSGAVKADLSDPNILALCERYRNERFILPGRDPRGKVKGEGILYYPSPYRQELFFTALSSERINATLYFAGLQDLVPVANHDLFTKLYGAKLKRAIESPRFLNERGATAQGHRLKFSILSWQLFVEVIPKEAIEAKEIGQILTYRDESQELLAKYRSYLGMIETGLAAESWDETLNEEIDKLVRGKVIPEIEQLEESRKVLWERLFGEAIKTTVQKRYLFPLISVAAIPLMSYWDLLWYSTVTVAGASAATALGAWASKMLPKFVDTMLEERKLKRSALFFLLNFK